MTFWHFYISDFAVNYVSFIFACIIPTEYKNTEWQNKTTPKHYKYECR